MKKALITILLILLVLYGCTKNVIQTTENEVVDNPQISKYNVKEFTVHGSNFKYDIDKIEVNKGDIVKINFVNDDGFHDLVIEGYDKRTQRLQTGQNEAIEFTVDKQGEFEYYCSVGEHRQMGMKGKLVVKLA